MLSCGTVHWTWRTKSQPFQLIIRRTWAGKIGLHAFPLLTTHQPDQRHVSLEEHVKACARRSCRRPDWARFVAVVRVPHLAPVQCEWAVEQERYVSGPAPNPTDAGAPPSPEAPSPPVVRRPVKICLACARRQWQGRVHIHPNHDLTKARTNPPPPNPTAPSSYSFHRGPNQFNIPRAGACVVCRVGQGSQSQQALGRQVISRSEQRRTGTGVGREEDSPQSAAARNRRRRRQSAGIGRSCERRGGSSRRRRRAGTLPAQ